MADKVIEILGFKMLVDDSECSSNNLISGAVEEPQVTDKFKEIIRPGMVVCDIGASLGFYSMLSANLLAGQGKVYSFEPNLTFTRYIKESVRLNNYNNVEVVEKAVFDKSGELLYCPEPTPEVIAKYKEFPPGTPVRKCYNGWIVSEEKDPGYFDFKDLAWRVTRENSIKVDGISLDDFFYNRNEKVNLMKIDVECFEYWVLAGARNLIARCDDLKILVELHSHKEEDVIALALELGLDVQDIISGVKINKGAIMEFVELRRKLQSYAYLLLTKG